MTELTGKAMKIYEEVEKNLGKCEVAKPVQMNEYSQKIENVETLLRFLSNAVVSLKICDDIQDCQTDEEFARVGSPLKDLDESSMYLVTAVEELYQDFRTAKQKAERDREIKESQSYNASPERSREYRSWNRGRI